MEHLSTSVLVAAATVFIAFWMIGTFSDPLRARLQGLVWSLAFVGVAFEFRGRFPWPLFNFQDGLIWGCLLLGLFIVVSPKSVGVRYFIRGLIVIAFGYLILAPLGHAFVGSVNQRNLLAFFFLGLGLWSILERSSAQVKISGLLLLPILSLIGLAWLLMKQLTAGQGLALTSGEVGLLMAPIVLHLSLLVSLFALSLLVPQKISPASVLPYVSVMIVAEMAAGHFYLRINPWFMVWLCLPFLLLWIRGWMPFVPKDSKAEAIMLGVMAGLPMAYLFISGPLS